MTSQDEGAVESPCIRVCVLDAEDICEGCYRSVKEIGDWPALDASDKRQVLKNCWDRAKSRGRVL